MSSEETAKIMADLRVQFPEPGFELVPLELRMGLFVLRNPTHMEHMMAKKMVMDDAQKHLSSHNLFNATCVYPSKDVVTQKLNRWPGMVSQVAVQKALAYLSGATDELESKS